MRTGLGSFSLGVKLTSGWVLCAHTGLHRGKTRRPLSHGMAQAQVYMGLACTGSAPPPLQEARGGAPDCRSLLSTCQLSTSVLPSSGGKQPVTVCLLWIQQAAFVSPNSETLQKQQSGQVTASWEGSHKSEAQHNGGKKQLYLCSGTYCCVCFV